MNEYMDMSLDVCTIYMLALSVFGFSAVNGLRDAQSSGGLCVMYRLVRSTAELNL